MTCPTCGDPLDAIARCAGVDVCSACSFADGTMWDDQTPDDARDAA